MDKYDWENVPELYEHPDYYKIAPEIFKKLADEMNLKPKGLMLDVCSGPVSMAAVYKNTVAFDYPEEVIKKLRSQGIKSVMGNIVEGLPFEDKTFDYVVSIGLPMRPYEKTDAQRDAIFHEKYLPTKKKYGEDFVEFFVDELIRVAKKRVAIVSYPVVELRPKKHEKKIERIGSYYVVYKVKGWVWRKTDKRIDPGHQRKNLLKNFMRDPKK